MIIRWLDFKLSDFFLFFLIFFGGFFSFWIENWYIPVKFRLRARYQQVSHGGWLHLSYSMKFFQKSGKKISNMPPFNFFQILPESVFLMGGKINGVIWPPTHHQQGQKHEKREKSLKSSLSSPFFQVLRIQSCVSPWF